MHACTCTVSAVDLTYSTLSSLAAAYNTEKVPPPHSPAYSFGLPVYHSGADPRSQTPAPNAYVLPHLIGTVTQVKAASPAYSIAGRRISGSFHDDLHKVTDASTIRPLRVYICSLHYIVTISIIFAGRGGGRRGVLTSEFVQQLNCEMTILWVTQLLGVQ